MQFESMWPLVFLLAVPVVILLYLLVPKGKDTKVSSNLLWQKLFYNRQSKTFLEKFIHNLLMYLQILIVFLLVLALMSPFLLRDKKSSGSIVYVLDTSGSMKHLTKKGDTRFAAAVKEIRSQILASDGTKISIVTNDGTGSRMLAVNSTDKKTLQNTLKKVKCSDTEGDLSSVLSTVQTLQSGGQQKDKAQIIFYTDGVGAKYAKSTADALSARVRVMGDSVSNVANTFLSCTREKDSYRAAAGLVNYSSHKVKFDVSLYEGKKLLSVRTVTLKPEESFTCLFSDVDWKGEPLCTRISSVSFEGTKEKDSLSADNCAYALYGENSDVDAVLIGEGNTYLEKAYQAVTGKTLTKTELSSSLEKEDSRIRIYDAGVYPEDAKKRMVFAEKSEKQMKNVSLSARSCQLTEGIDSFAIGVNETYVYDLPEWATGFLWSGKQCAAYYGEHDGIREVVMGFDIRESDFALKPEFPVLMANAFHFLGDDSLLAGNVYTAGEKVLFHARSNVDIDSILAPTDEAGIYRAEAGELKENYIVKFPCDSQSDGRITEKDYGTEVSAQRTLSRKHIRNFLLVLALLVMILEWVLYVKQMRYQGRFYLVVRLIGLSLLLLALCGLSVNIKKAEDTTVFLVDLSESNAANQKKMENYLREQVKKMPGKNQYGIVAFGENALVEQFLTDKKQASPILSAPERAATNIEEAVSAGLSLIPDGAAGRLVVLTDGKETKGDITRTVSALTAKKVQLLSVLYEDTEEDSDAYIEDVDMPDYLYQGDSYTMTVTVVSNYDTDARLKLLQGTKLSSVTKVHLNKGSNSFAIRQKVTGEESEQYTVKVEAPGDGCEENDSFYTYAAVDSLPKILVISGMKEDSTQFCSVLEAAGCNFRVVSAKNAPETLKEMLQYKSIILENVYRTDLPEGFLKQVETYVKDYGCGLICCGGEESYALGGYRDTELEKVLPVDMQLRGQNEKQNLAMVMVIDHSGSMSVSADGNGATNLDLAIAAADAAVDQLSAKDEVGVVTFDDHYNWQVPLQKVTDKDAIHEKIETVNEGGGTTIKPAVRTALDKIKQSSAQLKHIVLLTDGQGETRNFTDIVEECQKAGVTLSTVAVGEDSDGLLLENLAGQCGGRYYYSDISTDIPKIFAQEVFLSGDTYLQNGDFPLAVNGGNAITKGLFENGWPDLLGYVSASPKNGTKVLIAAGEKEDPILSVMQYGLGHTVAWNSDVTNRWTAGYARSDEYVQLWKRIVDYSAGSGSLGEDSVDVTTVSGKTHLTYEAKDYSEKTAVETVYTDPDGETHSVKLSASGPGVYEADLETGKSGVYDLSVRRMNGDNIDKSLMTAAVVQYSEEYKFALTSDRFCAFVKQYGKMITEKTDFWKKLKASKRSGYDITNILLMLLILLFVADVAMRRFSFVPPVLHWTKGKKKNIIAKEVSDRKTEPLLNSDLKGDGSMKKDSGKIDSGKKDSGKKRSAGKEPPQALDTSALLKKKEERHYQ